MRYTLQLPTDRVSQVDEFLTAEALAEMGQAAEAAGFDSCFVTDHPIPEDRWLASGGHHALDPFVALSFVAAATRKIRIQTHVLVLPYRNPFITAKSVASLDLLSRGRLIVGVAAGYLEQEFDAVGADFARRNEICDETLLAMREAWRGESVTREGLHFRATGNTALPRPAQRPAPPIWVGGNSKRAIRRAIELGDGWLPFPAPARMAKHIGTAALEGTDDLRDRLAYANTHAAKVGREAPLDIVYSPVGQHEALPEPSAFIDLAAELEAIGVTWLVVSLPHRTRAEFLDEIARFG
ncbi:MAG: LLM class F420-dependent oxidoreductase, partial [Deltaproteobacteria bacterium]|nr:LLM class F420-dependent oxidoreductase [Deltaproteobacteria bacterium]